ncbi:hypothetical protein CkaCkLH20_12677 [Colletotrichum karsti]|uniref:Ribosome biogenesis protein ALB1 n=1 Tax=Colletotrichum karsti TaxID=1095194 RepID=A0A9P6LE20_9PEZI|nr:uncharacterized protein CkaCkLH20_12677 [Colletotrichum karsti]KAF9869878.1 hypothetical protein CkaCkLH20_12677 [Colletotrichum karsti]
MPSVKTPNHRSKNRLAAQANKAKRVRQKKSEENKNKIAKTDSMRGARPGLLPTSGPNAPLSKKKAKKLEKKMAHAIRRKMAAEGEVEMADVEEDEKAGEEEKPAAADTEMDNIQ